MDTAARAHINQPARKNASIRRDKNSIVVGSVSNTHEATLSQEDFDKWLNVFRDRYSDMLEYLRSH